MALGREEISGWNAYPPATEMPKIRSDFRNIAARLAQATGGQLDD